MKQRLYLHKNWEVKVSPDNNSKNILKEFISTNKWFPATVPGTVHTDLLDNNIIPEPFYSDNELKLQWIDELDWIYKNRFDLPEKFDLSKPVSMVLEGVDTIAEIILNGKSIGKTENMFLQYEFEISSLLKKKNNKLEIKFTSPYKYARSLENKHGKLPVALNSERVYIRKAQYSFGWDWGPSFATSGVWKPIYLTQKKSQSITNIKFDTISISKNSASVEIVIELKNKQVENAKLKCFLNDVGIYDDMLDQNKSGQIKINYDVKNPKLWWPNNYGDPNLYYLKVQIVDSSDNIIDEKTRKVGLRKIDLKLEEDGKSQFQFVVNNQPIFAKGANWIPADSFIPRITDKKYRTLIQAAKDANMNILRVWGGGFYEQDIFYELCDELGIMVWQDFMFACAAYPEIDSIIDSVKEEVKQNVNRLQNHPCIAIWCGNNENEWIWQQEQKTSYKSMPGYKIYHEIIPSILKKLDPYKPYWPSSPFGKGDDPNSELDGNRHQWYMWSFWVDYNKVVEDKSLFVTEFGFQSAAGYDAMKMVLPKDQLSAQSKIFEFHNKQVEGPERLFKFLSGHLPVNTNIKDFIYLTQLNQGLALKKSVEHWQSRFPKSNGAIIWQINDCWPVASWALIDSDLTPKLSYYLVKNSFNPYLISFDDSGNNLNIFLQNNSLKKLEAYLDIKYVHLPSGKIDNSGAKKVTVKALNRKNIMSFESSDSLKNGKGILIVSLLKPDGELIQRNYYNSIEWKYLKLPKAKLDIKFVKNKLAIKIKSDKPAFFVFLRNKSILLSDNGFIILPGEEKTIKYELKNKKSFKNKFDSYTLNQYLS